MNRSDELLDLSVMRDETYKIKLINWDHVVFLKTAYTWYIWVWHGASFLFKTLLIFHAVHSEALHQLSAFRRIINKYNYKKKKASSEHLQHLHDQPEYISKPVRKGYS